MGSLSLAARTLIAPQETKLQPYSMAVSDDENPSDDQETNDENPSDYQQTDTDFEEEDEESGSLGESDSDYDQSYGVVEETRARFSNISVKSRSRTRSAKDLLVSEIDLAEVVVKSYEKVQEIVKAGQLEKLKVDQCKVYLRKNGLRLSGNKDSLIQRIQEHLEILDGEGEKKYPASSFVLDCKGDACTGDIVMFEQNVYETYNIASRGAAGPPCGKRIIAGRIVKESYGAAKQQHTFTIEVLWSRGEKPLPALYPLLIKGRNLYRLKILRQRWEDEGERQKVLKEKHSRGSLARHDREVRIQKKERRRIIKTNKVSRKKEPIKSQSLSKPAAKKRSQFKKSGTSVPQATDIQKLESFAHSKKPTSTLQQPRVSNGSMKLVHEEPAAQRSQPGFTVQPSFRPQNSNPHQQPYSSQNQFSQNPVKRSSIQEGLLQNYDYNHPNSRHATCNIRRYQSPPCGCPDPDCMTKFPRRDYSRQPLSNLNYGHPTNRPNGHDQQRQPCHHFARGRCYFGQSCKFSHESSSHVQGNHAGRYTHY